MYDNFLNWLTLKINKMNPVIFVAVVIQVVFLIIIIIAIVNLTQPQEGTTEASTTPSSHLSITNINQQISNLPQSSYEEIVFSIYDAAWLNRNDRELPDFTTSNIREGSTTRQYFEDIDVHQVNFVIDLPELQQSYQVNYLWSKDPNNTNIPTKYKTLVYCPEDSQKVYSTQTNCIDRYAGTIKQIIQTLPH